MWTLCSVPSVSVWVGGVMSSHHSRKACHKKGSFSQPSPGHFTPLSLYDIISNTKPKAQLPTPHGACRQLCWESGFFSVSVIDLIQAVFWEYVIKSMFAGCWALLIMCSKTVWTHRLLTVRSKWLGILTVWFRLLFALSDHNHHFHPLFNTMLFSTSRHWCFLYVLAKTNIYIYKIAHWWSGTHCKQ